MLWHHLVLYWQDFLHRAESDKQRYIAELKEFQKPELHHAAKSNATEGVCFINFVY